MIVQETQARRRLSARHRNDDLHDQETRSGKHGDQRHADNDPTARRILSGGLFFPGPINNEPRGHNARSTPGVAKRMMSK